MKKRIAIVLVGIIAIVLGKGLFYYRGFYSPPSNQIPTYENIIVPPVSTGESYNNVSDNISQTVLIDLAHGNNFDIKELNVLMMRLISRGLTIKLLNAETDLKKELSGEGENKTSSFIVVSPQTEFSNDEEEAIDKFVEDGGKVLLLSDPTRPSKINNISLKYGLIFEPDYLYNMKENEANFRNIFVSDFKQNEITNNLKKIALYIAGSVSSVEGGIALADNNTFSSLIESRGQLSPIALVKEGKVLAIHDLTFMTEPYNGVLDNNKLIANIAGWLSSQGVKETGE